MSVLSGVYVAAVTPFRDDAEHGIDTAAYLRHLGWLADHGVDGVVLFGTNGEGPSLTLAEKWDTLQRVLAADLGVSVVPTVAEANLADAVELTRRISQTGAAAVMVLPPYYFKPVAPEGLRSFYSAVLGAAAHPVIAYHIPKYAVPVPAEVVADLPLWGVKDSAAAEGYAEAVLAAGRGVLLGTESGVWQRLGLGAQGMVSALANAAPEQVVALYRHHREGNETAGREAEAALAGLRARTKEYAAGPGILKLLAEHRHGAPMGPVRTPLLSPPRGVDTAAILAAAGVAA